ncbi:MAG: branched-chain amino acid aminotransferase [Acidisphaera sp.]|nr:branched-chain amino acid aminotransferase [Acidisphaera sp.]
MTPVPFDDRDGVIWLDGAYVPWREARLHVLSHGLHYASAVFEGERAYAGRIFKLREHTDRLIGSARILGFDLPFDVATIDAACEGVLAANGLSEAYVRPIAWRGSEQLSVAGNNTKVHLSIACWAWPNVFGADRMRGLRMTLAEWRRPDPATAPVRSKASGLYMIGTLARNAAETAGYDDALMLDWRGRVAEATGANVFFVIDGALHTPDPDCFLDGITRRTVMALARRLQMQVVQRAIMPEELGRASEAFIVGTAAEVTAVRSIGAHAYTPGRVTETLLGEFQRLVRLAPEEVARLAA